jgi:hypothetical protein
LTRNVCFEVPDASDEFEAVVDGLAAPAALMQYLPVFEPGDVVFDAGPDASMRSPVLVAGGAAGLLAMWVGERRGVRYLRGS